MTSQRLFLAALLLCASSMSAQDTSFPYHSKTGQIPPSDYFQRVLKAQKMLNPENPNDPTDCATRTVVCGNGTLNYNSLGNGSDEFPNGITCLEEGEHQSSWYEINISSAGTIEFDITPIAGWGEDYDFAIWGPNPDCQNLGNPIRCSYADFFCSYCPQTGLGNGTTDVSENAWGNGYVAAINAQAGDTYYILVDNFSASSTGFDLTWTGTAGLGNIEVDPVPDLNVCKGGTFNLNPGYDGNGNANYTWSANPSSALAFLDNPNRQNPLLTVPDSYTGGPMTFFVDIQENSCFGDNEVQVTVEEMTLEAEVYDASCNLANGSITVSVENGNAPFGASWSNGTTQQNLNGLSEGAYTLLLIDAYGCTAEGTYIIEDSPAPLLALPAPPIACGEYTLPPPQGANLPLSTAYFTEPNGGGTQYNVGDVLTNSQTLYIFADAGQNCTDETSFTVTISDNIEAEIVQTLCFSDSLWVNGTWYGANNSTGIETIQGATANGCDSVISIDLTILPELKTVFSETICDNEERLINGILYNATNPSGIEVLQSAAGCDSIVEVSLEFYDPATSPFCYFNTDLTGDNVKCYGDENGALTLTVLEGEPPYIFTWINTETGETGSGEIMANNTPYNVLNLPVGTYEVTIQQTTYFKEETNTFTVVSNSQLEVQAKLSDFNGYGIACAGDENGSIRLDISGGTLPYSLTWGDGSEKTERDNLPAGLYHFTLSDGEGCTQTDSLELTAPDSLGVEFSIQHERCFGEGGGLEIDWIAGGVAPYRFVLDSGLFAQNTDFQRLAFGNHKLMLLDSNQCAVIENFYINPAEPFDLDAGRDTLVLSGDEVLFWLAATNPLDTVLWSPSEGVEFVSQYEYAVTPLRSTEYELTAIDENGCTTTDRVQILVELEREIYAPNIINLSDQLGKNDRFTLFTGRGVERIESLQFYDRWGALIDQLDNIPPNDTRLGWNGTYADGKSVETGIYIYQGVLLLSDGRRLPIKGDVAVVK